MTHDMTTKADSDFPTIRLSEFLAGCHSTELQLFFESYEYGLATVLHAVPIRGEKFKVMITLYSGFTREFIMPEEAILDTPAARGWRDKRASENRMIILKNTDERDAKASILTDTTGEFDRKALTRRLQILYKGAQLQPLDSLHIPRTRVPKRNVTYNKFSVLKPAEATIMEAADHDETENFMDFLDGFALVGPTDEPTDE